MSTPRRASDLAAPSRLPLPLVALLALASAAPARADETCYSDDECAPWSICTVSLGDCGAAAAPLDVCTGTCVAGQRWRIVPRVGGTAALSDDTELGANLGVELVPPIVGGHASLSAEWWTQEVLRMGGAVSWPLFSGLLVGARLDATTLTGDWGTMASGRIELFPWWPLRDLTPAHYVSLTLEAGASLADAPGLAGASSFVGLGLGLWPRTW